MNKLEGQAAIVVLKEMDIMRLLKSQIRSQTGTPQESGNQASPSIQIEFKRRVGLLRSRASSISIDETSELLSNVLSKLAVDFTNDFRITEKLRGNLGIIMGEPLTVERIHNIFYSGNPEYSVGTYIGKKTKSRLNRVLGIPDITFLYTSSRFSSSAQSFDVDFEAYRIASAMEEPVIKVVKETLNSENIKYNLHVKYTPPVDYTHHG